LRYSFAFRLLLWLWAGACVSLFVAATERVANVAVTESTHGDMLCCAAFFVRGPMLRNAAAI
jgi:hypothetical protein